MCGALSGLTLVQKRSGLWGVDVFWCDECFGEMQERTISTQWLQDMIDDYGHGGL
jgi:hypothetical protein